MAPRHICLAKSYFRLVLLLLAIGIACPKSIPGSEPSARQLFKRGRNFEKKGDFAQAYLLYSQAAAKDPANLKYWQRSQALQTRAAREAKVMPQGDVSAAAVEPDTANGDPEVNDQEAAEARKPQPPFELKASPGSKDFDLRADSKSLFEQVAKAYGLDVVFDGDYQATQPIRFRLTGANYREALYALTTASSSFIVPIGDKLFLVAKDTEQKRREVEVTVAVAVPIPEPVTIQEAQELARAVQQVMEIQRFGIDSAHRTVLIRDRVSKVRPALALFQDLLHQRAQIVIEAELLTVAKTSSMSYGLSVPTQISIETLVRNLTLGGGGVGFAIGVFSAQALATASRSSGTTLVKADMRTSDGLPATMKAGEKYPIMTVGYFGNTSGNSQVYTPPPSFNFEDLGLTLKVTPKVHDSHEVTLEVEAEFKQLTGASFNGIPVISNRRFANRVRLGFDQGAIIAGLVTANRSRSFTGLAGTGSIPILGGLLGQTTRDRDDVELVLILQPRLVDLPPSEIVTKQVWLGSETRLLSPL